MPSSSRLVLSLLLVLLGAAHGAEAGWLWSSSRSDSGSVLPHTLPYAETALKGLYESGVIKEVPKKLDEFSSKASQALQQISDNPNLASDVKTAAQEALKTGNLDKVTSLLGDDKLVSDATLQLAKQSLEGYGTAYENYAEYFYQLSPTAGGGKPTGNLAKQIEADYGSFDKFKSQFVEQANWVWGSSFVWLVADRSGKLRIETSRFQRRPAADKKVILSLFMWERVLDSPAFNGNYKAYADKFFDFVGWDTVGKRFDEWQKECGDKGNKSEL